MISCLNNIKNDLNKRLELILIEKNQEMENMKSRYESKLGKVEGKLRELVEAKKNREEQLVAARAKEMTDVAVASLSREYELNINK